MATRMMTDKKAAAATGWSESWLKSHECGWCGQTVIQSVKGNCGARDMCCDGTQWKREAVLARRKLIAEVLNDQA